MLFPKDTTLLVRAEATAMMAVVTLLVFVPCMVLFFAVSPEASSPPWRLLQLPVTCWAGWALVSLWAALAFVAALAPTRSAGGPFGHAGFVGRIAGRFECRGFAAGGDVAHLTLKSGPQDRVLVTRTVWFAGKFLLSHDIAWFEYCSVESVGSSRCEAAQPPGES